jgi:hypothetical protein
MTLEAILLDREEELFDFPAELRQLNDISDAIETGKLQLAILCEMKPERADKYQEQHNAAVKRMEKEAERLLSRCGIDLDDYEEEEE